MTSSTTADPYRRLDFNSPMTGETADALVAELATAEPDHVLDIGCGWAELLLRLLAACPRAAGHGVDHADELLERARRNATDRGLTSQVTFGAGLDGLQPADLVLNVGAEHVFGTLDRALVELHRFVRSGGRLLLGTLFWERPPTAELVEAFGELPSLAELIDAATSAGWRPLDLRVATPQDWDHFEFGFLADWEDIVMSPGNADEAERARRAADDHRVGYLERRGVLGFAFLILGRPHEPDGRHSTRALAP